MKNIRFVKNIIIIIFVILALTIDSHGFRLKEVSSIDLDKPDRVYGHSTGNIVIQKENKLQILNRRFKLRTEVPLDSALATVVSESGLFYSLVYKRQNTDSINFSATATVYGNRQVPLWSVYDLIEGTYYLLSSGECLLAVAASNDGLNYTMYLYHKDRPVIEVGIQLFDYLILGGNEEFILVDAGANGVKLYDIYGELIESYEPQKMIAFTEKKNKLAIYDHKGVLRLYEARKKRGEFELNKLAIKGLVARDEINRVAIIYNFNIVLFDSKKDSVLWEYVTGKEDGLFASVDISPNNKFVACGVVISKGKSGAKEDRHQQGFLQVYDINGQNSMEIEFNYDIYSKGLPGVKFLADNRTIAVRNAEKLHFIEIF